MPEHVSGPPGVPSRGDTERLIRDTQEQLEQLGQAVAELGAQLEELRRSVAPGPARHTAQRRRRGDTFLRVVKAAVIAAASLGVLLAAMAPARIHRERSTPRCVIQCSRPVAHHASRAPG